MKGSDIPSVAVETEELGAGEARPKDIPKMQTTKIKKHRNREKNDTTPDTGGKKRRHRTHLKPLTQILAPLSSEEETPGKRLTPTGSRKGYQSPAHISIMTEDLASNLNLEPDIQKISIINESNAKYTQDFYQSLNPTKEQSTLDPEGAIRTPSEHESLTSSPPKATISSEPRLPAKINRSATTSIDSNIEDCNKSEISSSTTSEESENSDDDKFTDTISWRDELEKYIIVES